MAVMSGAPSPPSGDNEGSVGHTYLLPCMLAPFFTWGFATVLVDIIAPKLKSLFDLSYTEATLPPFCFFFAYAVISLPAGALVGRINYMRGLVLLPHRGLRARQPARSERDRRGDAADARRLSRRRSRRIAPHPDAVRGVEC